MGSLDGITAVILAGGLGTRLRPVVSDRPKVLAEVCGRPFLTYLLDQLQAAGPAKPCCVRAIWVSRSRPPWAIAIAACRWATRKNRPPWAPPGPSARLARPGSDPVLVLNGDSYFDADLPDLLAITSVMGQATLALPG